MIYTIDFVIFCICRSIESNLPSPRGFVACNIYTSQEKHTVIHPPTYPIIYPIIIPIVQYIYIYIYVYIYMYIYIYLRMYIYILSTMKNKLICCCFFLTTFLSPFFQTVFSGTYLEELDKDLDLMIYFASCGRPSQYGSWGMIEAMDQPRDQAYKYQAVQDGKGCW